MVNINSFYIEKSLKNTTNIQFLFYIYKIRIRRLNILNAETNYSIKAKMSFYIIVLLFLRCME